MFLNGGLCLSLALKNEKMGHQSPVREADNLQNNGRVGAFYQPICAVWMLQSDCKY